MDISAGAYGSAAVDKDGKVYVWGNGTNGEIGNSAKVSKSLPTMVNIKNVVKVTMGQGHVSVLTTEGTVWAWGLNTSGQLGINNGTTTTWPMKTALKVTDVQNIS